MYENVIFDHHIILLHYCNITCIYGGFGIRQSKRVIQTRHTGLVHLNSVELSVALLPHKSKKNRERNLVG